MDAYIFRQSTVSVTTHSDWNINFYLTNQMWFSIVCILIDNGKLADQIMKLVAIVVKIYKNLFYLL